MKKTLKYGLSAAAIISAATFGDELNVNDKMLYPLIYRNTPIADGNYRNPFSVRKRYLVHNGLLEVQIGDANSNEYYTVKEGLRINERPMYEQALDTADDVLESLGKKARNLAEKVREELNNLRGR